MECLSQLKCLCARRMEGVQMSAEDIANMDSIFADSFNMPFLLEEMKSDHNIFVCYMAKLKEMIRSA